MPTVPTSNSPQVLPDAVPQNRFRAPQAQATAAQNLQQAGAQMQGAGGEVASIALDMQRQANQVRVNDAMNQAIAAKLRLTYDPSEGYTHIKGDSALTRPDNKSLNDEFQELLENNIGTIEDSLGNDAQKLAFRQQAEKMKADFSAGIQSHVSKEYGTYQANVHQGTIDLATQQMALSWGDSAAVKQSREAIKASVYQIGKLQGLPATLVQAKMAEELSPGHAAVIASAVDAGQLDYAREYMKQVTEADELTAKAKLSLDKLLDEGQFEERTQQATDDLLAKHGEDTKGALQEARDKYSGKERDSVVSRIKAREDERVALRERAQSDAADRAWQLLDAGEKVPPSLLALMDGRDAQAVRKALTAAPVQHTNVNKWLEFTNLSKNAMAAMSPNQLLREYREHFTDADLRTANEMLLEARDEKASTGGLQLRTTADLLKRTAKELGILPESGKVSGNQEAAYLQFTNAMQDRINDWEATHDGKKATPEVLSELLDKEKLNKVWLSVWGPDKEVPLIAVSPDQLGDTYLKVGSEEIKASDIPADYRLEAIQKMEALGITATEQRIAEGWQRRKTTWPN